MHFSTNQLGMHLIFGTCSVILPNIRLSRISNTLVSRQGYIYKGPLTKLFILKHDPSQNFYSQTGPCREHFIPNRDPFAKLFLLNKSLVEFFHLQN